MGRETRDSWSSAASSEASAWAQAAGSEVFAMGRENFSFLSCSSPSQESLDCSNDLPESILDWGFDAIAVNDLSCGNPIGFVTDRIFSHNPQIKNEYSGCVGVLRKVFTLMDSSYNPWAISEGRKVMFHNATHGADVTQALHYFLQGPPGLLSKLTPSIELSKQKVSLVMLAAVFASAVHDYDHPGLSNDFLINSKNALCENFQGDSVLEKYHCAKTFALLDQHKFGKHLSKKEYSFFKSIVTDMILATDLGHHFELMNRPALKEDFRECLCMLLHVSDISNVARPGIIAKKWTDRVMEEFFAQGDAEKRLNLPLTPMMDRESAHIQRIQAGFIDVIARPLFLKIANLIDDEPGPWIHHLEKNRAIS